MTISGLVQNLKKSTRTGTEFKTLSPLRVCHNVILIPPLAGEESRFYNLSKSSDSSLPGCPDGPVGGASARSERQRCLSEGYDTVSLGRGLVENPALRQALLESAQTGKRLLERPSFDTEPSFDPEVSGPKGRTKCGVEDRVQSTSSGQERFPLRPLVFC